jgi:hypothetical protein
MTASLEHHSLYAIDEAHGIEVEEEADFHPGKSKIRQQLRLVNRGKPVNGLDLDKHSLRNDQVGAKSAFQLDAVVVNRNGVLTLEEDFGSGQLVAKALFIY